MTVPVVPDSVGKLFIIIGLTLGVYALYTYQQAYQKFFTVQQEYSSELERLSFEYKLLQEDLQEINEEVDFFAKRNGVKNPMSLTDSSYTIVRTISGSAKDMAISDTVNALLKNHQLKKREIAKKSNEVHIKGMQFDRMNSEYDSEENTVVGFAVIGVFCFLAGLFVWALQENFDDTLKLRQNLDKPTFSKYCQSCGKVFNGYISHGTINDNKLNYHFCSSCYAEGKFTNESLTFNEISDEIVADLTKNKISRQRIRQVIKKVKKLDRWKSDNYI